MPEAEVQRMCPANLLICNQTRRASACNSPDASAAIVQNAVAGATIPDYLADTVFESAHLTTTTTTTACGLVVVRAG